MQKSKFRLIVEKALQEAKIIKIYPDEFEWLNDDMFISYLRVYKNPTKSEMMSICDNSIEKEIRGLCINDDLYVWDAYYANHADILSAVCRADNIENDDRVVFFMIINGQLYISNDVELPDEQFLQITLASRLTTMFSEDELKKATNYHDAPVKEDTVKQGNSWVNKGKEGTHGKFKSKKAADDQRKAMFANGYKG